MEKEKSKGTERKEKAKLIAKLMRNQNTRNRRFRNDEMLDACEAMIEGLLNAGLNAQ